MSWGFYIDLELTLPTARWKQLARTTAADHATVAPGWFGLQEIELEEAYLDATFDDLKLGTALEFFEADGSVCDVHDDGDDTFLRVCQLVDRGGDTGIVKPIAAIFEGAKDVATGHIQLVNDGSYSGEDGAILAVANGKVRRKRIEDARPIAAKLASQTVGDLEAILDQYTSDAAKQRLARAKQNAASKVAKPKAKKQPVAPAAQPSTRPAAKKSLTKPRRSTKRS